MADYSSHIAISKRKVFVLALPTNLTEVSKMEDALMQYLSENGITYWDDTVTVVSDGEYLRYEIEID